MRIGAVIVSWNGEAHIDRCLRSLDADRTETPTVVVDNNSSDRTVDIVRTHRASLIANDSNRGFTAAANQGMRALLEDPDPPEAILLLNQDAWLDTNTLDELSRAFAGRPDAGVIGCQLLYPAEDRIQHAGGLLERPRMVGRHLGHRAALSDSRFQSPSVVDFVTGAALCARTSTLREIGLFDETYSPGYYEDVDLCLRASAAKTTVVYWPRARVKHFESASFTNRIVRLSLSHRNRYLLALKHADNQSFWGEFERAEIDHVKTVDSVDDLRAVCRATHELLLSLNELSRRFPKLRRSFKKYRDVFGDALAAIRCHSIRRLTSRLSTPE